MSSNTSKQLELLIQSLPEKELKKLAAKIELDREDNRFGLPHDAILALLRPALAAIRAPRIYTPQRILCVPFEDMLIVGGGKEKEPAEISRTAILPMWKWLTEDLAKEEFAGAAERFKEAQKANDEFETSICAREIWRIAAEGLAKGLEHTKTAEGMKFLTKRFGGGRVIDDIKDMAAVLDIADRIEEMKQQLPRKPIMSFSDRHVTTVKRIYELVEEEKPGLEIYVLFALIGRLLQPFPVLKVVRSFSRKGDDLIVSKTELGQAGEIVLKALERDAEAVAVASNGKNVDEADLVDKAKRFAVAFKAITASIGIRREGEWGQRMFAARSTVSEAVQRVVLTKADHVILTVFPITKKGTVQPDFTKMPDEDAYILAEKRSQALGEVYRFSDQIGLQSVCQSAIGIIRKELEGHIAKIIDQLARVGKDNREFAAAQMATAVRLLELISNSDEADLFRRRGLSALEASRVREER